MSPEHPSDAGVVDEDRRARFRVLYDAVYDDLWRYVQRRSVSDAEAMDTLSEVLLVAWRRFDDIPEGDGARPWLFGVARNLVRSGWRRRQRSAALTERLINELRAAPPTTASQMSDPDVLLEALGRLRETDRELLQLIAWEELSHREIAGVLGISENAVAIRVHRARARLTKVLDRAGGPALRARPVEQGES